MEGHNHTMFSPLLMSLVFLGSVKKNGFIGKSFSGEGRGKVEF